jgi:L-ascorbate metabolism protein UlaG (beta-lactamase superfamily)
MVDQRRATSPSETPQPGTIGQTTLTFIGTATTLLRLGRFTVLTDPNFLHRGQRAYLGYGLWSRRRTEPALQPHQLPDLDAVVLSHLHGDHFDRIARARLEHELPVITTAHAARRLNASGFRQAVPLGPWDFTELHRGDQRLQVTAVPGIHGPGAVGRLLMPPVMGSILSLHRPDHDPMRVYVTGDTIFRRELDVVTRRFADLDAIVIHLGGTRILGVLLTMDGRQGADLVELLRPPVTVPVHYDDYRVFRSPLSDFLNEVRRRDLPGEVRVVRRGDTVPLGPPAAG